MVKAIAYCIYAKNYYTYKVGKSTITAGKVCEKGYKKCTGQGCKCFVGNQAWIDYLNRNRKE
jgi:hypothetical protein